MLPQWMWHVNNKFIFQNRARLHSISANWKLLNTLATNRYNGFTYLIHSTPQLISNAFPDFEVSRVQFDIRIFFCIRDNIERYRTKQSTYHCGVKSKKGIKRRLIESGVSTYNMLIGYSMECFTRTHSRVSCLSEYASHTWRAKCIDFKNPICL